jgi:hypothetical protein
MSGSNGVPDQNANREAIMKTLLLTLALILCVYPSAFSQGWNEPTSVFNIPFGSSPDKVQDAMRADGQDNIRIKMCKPSGCLWPHYLTPTLFVDAFLTFNAAGGLAGAKMDANHSSYSELRAIVLERYGKPSQQDEESVQTHGGATLRSERISYVGESVVVTLKERCGSVNKSCLAIYTKELLSEGKRERDQAVKQGAKGL